MPTISRTVTELVRGGLVDTRSFNLFVFLGWPLFHFDIDQMGVIKQGQLKEKTAAKSPVCLVSECLVLAPHQCSPGLIPSWVSDPSTISEKGLSSPL